MRILLSDSSGVRKVQLFIIRVNSLKKAGFYNSAPNLLKLHKGDLAFEVDFRNVYADVLKSWLRVDDKMVLGSKFNPLGIV